MLKSEDLQRKTSIYRKLQDLDIEEMTKCIKATSRSEGNLDERVMDFNNALINALRYMHHYRLSRYLYVEQSHGLQMMLVS